MVPGVREKREAQYSRPVRVKKSTSASRITRMIFDEATRQGMSLNELSDRSGIFVQNLQKWKSGKAAMRALDGEILMECLGLKFEINPIINSIQKVETWQ